ncbi:hypothetical protein KP509_20G012500 [Ceratopteris richardii]|uniref:Uncharacterized protein n=1 Tax=Ceratopteris richardii TaxID=49495 RepID=A0A8T2SF78_CERRI|nr:hypothetical protein KP509_20G012500 [Ceratopteris richardii]
MHSSASRYIGSNGRLGRPNTMRQNQGGRGSTSASKSSSSRGSSMANGRRRKPAVWQDEMAEVRETFRRVTRARKSQGNYSEAAVLGRRRGVTSNGTEVTAPMLSRNRRAKMRSQVPPGGSLHDVQLGRSESPLVAFNHLQNVAGMCRRIRSQHSITERKKNPHDPFLYPVYLRRPWTVNTSKYSQGDNSPHISPIASEYHSLSTAPAGHHHSYVHPASHSHFCPHRYDSPTLTSVGHSHLAVSGADNSGIAANHCGDSYSTAIGIQSSESVSIIDDASATQLSGSPHISPNLRHRATAHGSPKINHVYPAATTSVQNSRSRFKPLFDISNGIFPHTQVRKRSPPPAVPFSQAQKLRTSENERVSWKHCRHFNAGDYVDEDSEMENTGSPSPREDGRHASNRQNPHIRRHNVSIHAGSITYGIGVAKPNGGHHNHTNTTAGSFTVAITKKPSTMRPCSIGCSESWPSSSSCFSNGHHAQIPSSCLLNLEQDPLNSDRRPHSENDLNLHSMSYFTERPPSRCMKRPLSSCCSWTNAADFLRNPKSSESPLDLGFVSAWSANSSSSQNEEYPIFIPRDLEGNILTSTSTSFRQRYYPKSNAVYRSTSIAGALKCLSRRIKAAGQQKSTKQIPGNKTDLNSKPTAVKKATVINSDGVRKKKPINHSSSSFLDDLEGLPPRKWAKRLAADHLMDNSSCAGANAKAKDYGKELTLNKTSPAASSGPCINNGFKHRVKFASPSVQIAEGDSFRREAQSLASVEMTTDLLSWERDSGLLTGDPPINVELHDCKSNMEAITPASSVPSNSPTLNPSDSPMQVCSPICETAHSSSKLPNETSILQNYDSIMPAIESNKNFHCQQSNEDYSTCSPGKQANDSDERVLNDYQEAEPAGFKSSARDTASEVVTTTQEDEADNISLQIEEANSEEPAPARSFISIHHETVLIEVTQTKPCDEVHLGMKDEEMKPADCNDANMEAEWELERLFQDTLDLNPTLRHIYDAMSSLNACVSSAAIS